MPGTIKIADQSPNFRALPAFQNISIHEIVLNCERGYGLTQTSDAAASLSMLGSGVLKRTPAVA